jgi:hypothetical protein
MVHSSLLCKGDGLRRDSEPAAAKIDGVAVAELSPIGSLNASPLAGHDHIAVDRERHLAGHAIPILQVSGQPRLGDGDQLLFAAADDPIGFRKVDLVDNLILQKNAPVAHKAGAAAPDQQRAGGEARHGAVVTNRAYDADLFAKGEFRSHVPLS